MDRRLRDLERRWRAERSDDVLLALLREYRRAGEEVPLELLRASPRWRRLTGFVAKWYARPLGDADGNTTAEVEARERQLGRRLPESVREWFRLVGRRLRHVQDHPVLLKDVQDDDRGFVTLYRENQDVVRWGCRADEPDDNDPPGTLEFLDGRQPPCVRQHASTSELLLGLILSETLIGACCGAQAGALGWLANEVRGASQGSEGLESDLARRYAPLPLTPWSWPVPGTHFRGDSDTLLRLSNGWVEVATRTEAAWARIDELAAQHGGWLT